MVQQPTADFGITFLGGLGEIGRNCAVLDQHDLRRTSEVPAGYLYVDGIVGDVGHGVLRDRQRLSQDGAVVVVVTVDASRQTTRQATARFVKEHTKRKPRILPVVVEV